MTSDRKEGLLSDGLCFLGEVGSMSDPNDAVERYLKIIDGFGFVACAAGAWTGVGAGRTYRFYFNSWPEEWQAIYREKNIFPNDPVIMTTRRRIAPFLLSEEESAMRAIPGASVAIDLSHAFGWVDVFCVPVHGPGSYQGLISLGAFSPLCLDDRDKWLLSAMSYAIYNKCHSTSGFGSRPTPGLTKRQIECMRWVALGKTDTEIAKIMRISAPTAHYHVERVKSVLGVKTRVEAVALLVLDGLL